MMNKRTTTTIVLAAGVLLVFQACRHEVDGLAADKMLFSEAKAGDLVYYVNTPGITAPAGDSPHGDFRVRFNSIAAAALDTITGELPVGASFPEGSLIVKDVYEGGNLSLYAIMKKAASDPFNDGGWIWAEIRPDGGVRYSASKKGNDCVGCHSSGTNRDLVRVFDLH
jgi:hypothetical protein